MSRRPTDLTGRRLGWLEVKHRDTDFRGSHAKWICVCVCGTEKSVYGFELLRGTTVSCKCKNLLPTFQRRPKAGKPISSLAYRKFGLWKVQGRFKRDEAGHILWRCICACGTEDYIEASALTRGRSKSCGCVLPFWPKVVAGKAWNAAHAR